jgi:hypothetical protein
MNNASNIKDTLSTICAWVIAICGGIIAVETGGVKLPEVVITVATSAIVVATVIIGILTGKNPNGTTKAIDPKTGQQEIPPKTDQK